MWRRVCLGLQLSPSLCTGEPEVPPAGHLCRASQCSSAVCPQADPWSLGEAAVPQQLLSSGLSCLLVSLRETLKSRHPWMVIRLLIFAPFGERNRFLCEQTGQWAVEAEVLALGGRQRVELSEELRRARSTWRAGSGRPRGQWLPCRGAWGWSHAGENDCS